MFSADLGVNQVVSYPPATDPPFQKVALLLHGDGTNGAQNNTFLDSSTNNFTITRTGNVAQGTFSPFSLAAGYWSNYFGASDAYFVTSSLISLSGNFTLEAWVYRTANDTNYSVVWNDATANVQIGYSNTGAVIVYLGGWVINNIGTALSANTWHHYAIVRSGTTVTAYVDGVSVASGTSSYTAGVRRVGGFGGTGYNVLGYLSNVRVTNTAVYSSAFTPPTNGLTAISGTQLLICQSNRFVDNSSNNYGLTLTGAGLSSISATAWSPFAPSAAYSASTNGGSAYFDGSGDYLEAGVSSLTLGTSDFTIEWFQYRSDTTTRNLINIGTTLITSAKNGTNGLQIYKTDNSINVLCDPTIALNTWNHIAIVRSGGVFSMYVNGISQTLTTNTNGGSIATTSTIQVGKADVSAYYSDFLGYASNVRLVTSAVYTANFTPPTAPLTAVTNTQLLLNCTNAGIIDNAGKNDIETVGNAQISTSVKKYGTGSMSFNLSANGDYLRMQCIPPLDLSSGNFTLEFWFYVNSWQVGSFIAQGANFHVGGDGASGGRVYYQAGSITAAPLTTGVSASTWHHLAIVRSSGTTKMYVDGVAAATSTTDTWTRDLTTPITVGYKSSYFNGYIDDLRITKGQALYTSNFTPPTQAFPNV